MEDLSQIEHTVLGPTTTWSDVAETLDTALQYGMRACIPPCYVEQGREYAPTVGLVTVVGFPHGQHTTESKCIEAEQAWKNGVDEIDVVCNLGSLFSGDDEDVQQELEEVVASVPIPVKVIVESHLLEEAQLRRVCEAVAGAEAAFVKTSTGFSDGGATVEDVAVMSEYLPVKASGGIGSWTFAEELLEAGAERIGASSGDAIAREYQDQQK